MPYIRFQFLDANMLFFNNKSKLARVRQDLSLCVLSSSLLVSLPSFADALDTARSIETQTNQEAINAQQKINQNADKTLDMQTQIEQMKEQIENQSIYQKHLQTLVESQQAELEKAQREREQMSQTREGIVPLMYRMLAGLEDLQTQSALPYKTTIRQERLQKLKDLMARADVSEAEKFRRILEAYQIEVDYGNKLSTYQDEIEIAAGDKREVELLALGQVSLIARSQDQQTHWLWSNEQKAWQEMDANQVMMANRAFELALGKLAPEMVDLPLSASVQTNSDALAQTKALASKEVVIPSLNNDENADEASLAAVDATASDEQTVQAQESANTEKK